MPFAPGEDRLSVSIAPINRIRGQHYADLPGTLALMRDLHAAGLIDGFEFQNLAEWDGREPPRDQRERRRPAWQASTRYAISELADMLQSNSAPIFSIHANRDTGICLCSEQPADLTHGQQLCGESTALADQVGAEVVVFHLWDTWKESFDLAPLEHAIAALGETFPAVRASVENVPTHLQGETPFTLARRFPWMTLDIRWAALYDELASFEAVVDRIVNVHLQARLDEGCWILPPDAPFTVEEAIATIRSWGYRGLWTVEGSGLRDRTWDDLAAALDWLRAL
jgi:hypothetical protein